MSSAATVIQRNGLHQQVVRYDIGFGIEGDDATEIAVEVCWPEEVTQKQVFFCVPGGGMNRRYFDLGGETDSRFSFARQMAARGYVSVLIDPPAIGESDRPEDGHALTPARITEVMGKLHQQVMQTLMAGEIPGLAAMPDLVSIGVGHSMGAMLTVLQQDAHDSHAALVLLGFGTRGLPQFLPPQAREILDDTEALRAALPAMAKSAFPKPYPVMHSSNGGEAGIFGSTHADPAGVQALKVANDVLLPVPALMSMFPGNVVPECAAVTVPVYLGIGERDLVGKPEGVPASFAASSDVKLQVLPQTGHSHFLFPARDELFDALADWAGRL